MRVVVVALLAVMPGCRQVFGIDDTSGPADAPSTGDDGGETADGRLDGGAPDATWVTDVAHLSPQRESELTHQLDVVISIPITIDTTTGTVTPINSGVLLTLMEQDVIGPDVYVADLGTVTVTAPVTIVGSRPLLVVADTISIMSSVDAAALASEPGPGGGASGAGPSPGAQGQIQGSDDSGAGGGGFGTAGGAGGNAGAALGGAPGSPVGDESLGVLVGGSGGGPASRCPNVVRGGAGGGALQITARGRLKIAGSISVGGGGGGGAVQCGGSMASGGGGGSGGALYLQAAVIDISGPIAANGGGGGGGGTASLNSPGEVGQDAGIGPEVALGGLGGGSTGWNGGSGAAGVFPAMAAGSFPSISNTGGGGGGVGRIVARTAALTGAQNASPALVQLPP